MMRGIDLVAVLAPIVLLLCALGVANAQPTSSALGLPPAMQAGTDPPALLEYARFLREEEKLHREYLEKLYTTTVVVLGALITLGLGLIGFLQFKTKKDVREAVDAQFKATVDRDLRDAVNQFRDQQLPAQMQRIQTEVTERIDSLIVSIEQRFDEKLLAAVRPTSSASTTRRPPRMP